MKSTIRRANSEPFAKYVRRILLEKGMREKELAAAADISASTLSAILNGRNPSWPIADRIMEVLGVQMTTLDVDEQEEDGIDLATALRELATAIEDRKYQGSISMGSDKEVAAMLQEVLTKLKR